MKLTFTDSGIGLSAETQLERSFVSRVLGLKNHGDKADVIYKTNPISGGGDWIEISANSKPSPANENVGDKP